jgi:RNA polymerase sigma factor (sigma-70 family)
MEAMDWLPSRQREVLCLHACQQLSLAEIAEVLQLSPEAVKASLSLARKKMRRWLNDLCPDRYPKL